MLGEPADGGRSASRTLVVQHVVRRASGRSGGPLAVSVLALLGRV